MQPSVTNQQIPGQAPGGMGGLSQMFLNNAPAAPGAGMPAQLPQIMAPQRPNIGLPPQMPHPIAQSAPKRFTTTPQAQFLLAMGANPKTLFGDNYSAWASAPATQGQLHASSGRTIVKGNRGGGR